MEKRKMGAHCQCGQCRERCDRGYHSNRERTNRLGSQRLGKNSVVWSLGLTAGMTRWHHGASTLFRHVVAALPFRGSHCRTRKNTRYGWRDRPQQGDRQQRECSGSSHPHKCTAFSGCDEQVLTSKRKCQKSLMQRWCRPLSRLCSAASDAIQSIPVSHSDG